MCGFIISDDVRPLLRGVFFTDLIIETLNMDYGNVVALKKIDDSNTMLCKNCALQMYLRYLTGGRINRPNKDFLKLYILFSSSYPTYASVCIVLCFRA